MDKPQIGIPDHLDFGINLMSMHSWLSEQKSSNYLEEIEELKHTLSIVSTILSLQQKRAYVSIKEVFDITLTPSEFKEYQEFADRANSSDVSDAPEISERILFLAIVQQDYLSRSQ